MTNVTTTPGPTQAPTSAYTVAQLNADYGPGGMPDQDLSFSQVLSMLNPLQYIPVVGSVYRAITGDTVPPAAQVLGGALLGGPVGLIASAADAMLQQATGKDVGDRMVAMFMPDSDTPGAKPSSPVYAAASTPQQAAAAAAPSANTNTDSSSSGPAASAQSAPAAAASSTNSSPPVVPQASATTVASQATAQAPQTAASTPAATAASTATPLVVAAGPAKPPAMAGAGKAGTGWTLADYRMFAGHGMPPSSGSNGMEFHNNPVPLQTTIPLPGEVSHPPVVPNMTPAAATATATATAAPASTTTPGNTASASQAQGTWVSQAMMRGLDRYRQMMIQQEQQQDQAPPSAPAMAPTAVPAASPSSSQQEKQ